MGKTEIDDATLLRVAQVCRLKLSESEKEGLKRDLNSILSYFHEINEIEAKGRELYYVREQHNHPRQDAPQACEEAPGIRSQFAKSKEGAMLAPKGL